MTAVSARESIVLRRYPSVSMGYFAVLMMGYGVSMIYFSVSISNPDLSMTTLLYIHKSNALKRESISKLPEGMALFVGL